MGDYSLFNPYQPINLMDDEDLTLSPYAPTEAYARQFRAGSVVRSNQSPYENLFDPPPPHPQAAPMSSLERLASTGNRGFLGRLGAMKLARRKEAEAEYMRQRQDWEDRQRMKYQQAQLESLDRERREGKVYGSPQWVTRGGKPVAVTSPEQFAPGDQPYQAPKTDMSVQPYEDYRNWFQQTYPQGVNEKGQSVAQAWKELERTTLTQNPMPQQPPQPSFSPVEYEDEDGGVGWGTFDRRTGKYNLPPKAKPHKTGVEPQPKADPTETRLREDWLSKAIAPDSPGGSDITPDERSELATRTKRYRDAKSGYQFVTPDGKMGYDGTKWIRIKP